MESAHDMDVPSSMMAVMVGYAPYSLLHPWMYQLPLGIVWMHPIFQQMGSQLGNVDGLERHSLYLLFGRLK